MYAENHIYHDKQQELHGFLAFDDVANNPRPAVLVAHDWSGRSEMMCNKASLLANMGYVGFALDMYGHARVATAVADRRALMQPLVNDRAMLRDRLLAALQTVSALPEVDSHRIAIIGYCFGGLCALDLARCGADIKGAVSFHGLLNQPELPQTTAIKAKVLVLHGYEDPMVKLEQVNLFCQEMTVAKVDWQVHMYGNVHHGFTNPHAHDTSLGLIYDELAAQRSWTAMTHFLEKIFQ